MKSNAPEKWDCWVIADNSPPEQIFYLKHTRKNFIPRNDGFICEACDETVPPAQGTFRNHCSICLTGKHVDDAVPGDRASSCQGLMPTISYTGTDPNKLDLVQKCKTCNKTIHNRTAPDDNVSQLFSEYFNKNNS